jgi:hypothetical protein
MIAAFHDSCKLTPDGLQLLRFAAIIAATYKIYKPYRFKATNAVGHLSSLHGQVDGGKLNAHGGLAAPNSIVLPFR